MNRAYRYALSMLGVLLIVAIATNINVPPTAAAGSAPVTVVNTPLPVSVTGTAGITGAVSISNTPDVRVTNFPVRLPYNFTLSGVFSTIWLRHFRFGPAEWLWRSLTYGQPQPLRARPS